MRGDLDCGDTVVKMKIGAPMSNLIRGVHALAA
jgi:hypothetical protein